MDYASEDVERIVMFEPGAVIFGRILMWVECAQVTILLQAVVDTVPQPKMGADGSEGMYLILQQLLLLLLQQQQPEPSQAVGKTWLGLGLVPVTGVLVLVIATSYSDGPNRE